jgi:DNA-binding MarR family transcriptional regulator
MMERNVGYYLKRAQHALRLAMDEALHALELTTPQYAALSALEIEPGLSNAALARRCFVTPQTMNMIVVQLENNQLVVRRQHVEHGRVLQTNLTPLGQERVQQAHQIVDYIEEHMVSQLSQHERQHLVLWLKTCSQAFEDRKEHEA